MDIGYIYKIDNLKNGKCYIGQTINYEKRIKQHKKARDDTALHRAIRKHGFENFIYGIVQIVPREDLDQREIMWIAARNTWKGHGYNSNAGGNTFSTGDDNPSRDPESVKKRSGDNHPSKRPEVRQNLSNSWTDERKVKQSKSTKEQWADEEISQKMKDGISKAWTDERKDKHSKKFIEYWSDPENREKQSERTSKQWTDERKQSYSENNPMNDPIIREKARINQLLVHSRNKQEKFDNIGQLSLFK